MTVAEILPSLESVHARGHGRWSARCPAHADKSPSLSVREGDRGILLKCFAGCSSEEICRALGLTVSNLFFEPMFRLGHKPTNRPARIDRRALSFKFELAALDLRVRAKQIVEAGKNLHIVALCDRELDRALDHAAQAYADLERTDIFEHVADTLRSRDWTKGKSNERQARVA